MHKVLIIHGPNLNLLGSRQPEIYGSVSQEDLLSDLRQAYPELTLELYQSNSESELVERIHRSKGEINGFLINAGAFSHSSIAIADALRSIEIPAISIHISNIYQREEYRHRDVVGEACQGAIVGLGLPGYRLALECLMDSLN